MIATTQPTRTRLLTAAALALGITALLASPSPARADSFERSVETEFGRFARHVVVAIAHHRQERQQAKRAERRAEERAALAARERAARKHARAHAPRPAERRFERRMSPRVERRAQRLLRAHGLSHLRARDLPRGWGSWNGRDWRRFERQQHRAARHASRHSRGDSHRHRR